MAQPFTMPARKHHSAPTFDGTAQDLGVFFEDFEDLAGKASLDDKDKIIYALRYAGTKHGELWKTTPTSKSDNWDNFKKEVIRFYPKADPQNTRRYTIYDLEIIAEKQTAIPISNHDQLADYQRIFVPVSAFLEEHRLISKREISQTFLRGFSLELRGRIWDRLMSQNATLYRGDEVEMSAILEAAQFLLRNNDGHFNGSSFMVSPSEAVKNEQTDLRALIQAVTAMHTSILQLHQSNIPQSSTTNQNKTYSTSCLFCGLEGHHINACAKVEDYINSGKCKRINGRLQLPNGIEIGRSLPGFNFQQKIDSWFSANPNTPTIPVQEQNRTGHPRTTVGMWQVANPAIAQYQWATETDTTKIEEVTEYSRGLEDDVESQEDEAVLSAAQAILEKRTTRSATRNARTEEIPHRPFTGNPANRPMNAAKPTNLDKQSTEGAPGPKATSAPKVTPPTVPQSSTNTANPQYIFRTPIEDVKKTQELYQLIMDVPIPGITPRHIFSVSPDIRKLIKEDTTTRKVSPDNTASVNLTTHGNMTKAILHEADISKYLSRPIETLRSISMTINDDFEAECLLDSGCQIVVVRKDVWQRSRQPLDPAQSLTMESANTNTDDTLGMIKALKMTVGEVSFWVPCQVVDKAAFEVLLGRPFTVVAEAVTKDYADGSQDVTLFDPVTGTRQTIPTHERIRRPSPHTGF